ncbi:MAG: glycerate kinase [Bacillota bacterium]
MKIIIAPDKFKGSMTATEAAQAIARGLNSNFPDIQLKLFPLSDGGEGLVEAMAGATGGNILSTTVSNPLGEIVEASWAQINNGQCAVIEMSAASGLSLLPPVSRNPGVTSTYGTGELIRAALEKGCSEIIIGIGGSATNDGGAGMACALGAKLLDKEGRQLKPGGLELLKLERIDISGLDSRLANTSIKVACDVDNPLTGPHGASYVYGPQKGAGPEMVKQLDRALAHYAEVLKEAAGTDVEMVPGAGAAGGLGAGLIAFLGAELHSGIDLVLDTLNIDQHLDKANLLITGEGRLDKQSLRGKAPVGIARRAKKYGLPVLVLAGAVKIDSEDMHKAGITAAFSITDSPMDLEEALNRGAELLEKKATTLIYFLRTVNKNPGGINRQG